MNFIKKYYISIIIVTSLFVIIVVAIYQSFHIATLIKQKSEEFEQIQLDYALAQEFLNNIHKFKQDNQYLIEFYDQISFFLPNEDDEKIKLFSTLEQLAKDTGNENLSLSVVKTPIAKDGDIIPLTDNYLHIKLSLIGSYNDLIYFMTKLENTKYFSDILSFSSAKTQWNREGEESRNNLLQTTLDVVFYLEANKE
jgi:Tfp pilus assembly protein PilO